MKIYLTDNYKVSIYTLPNKIEDSYTIKYKSYNDIEETLTIKAEKNNWVISSAENVEITKESNYVVQDIITDGNTYIVKFLDLQEEMVLYCCATPTKYYSFETTTKTEISFGRNGCDIVYDNPFVADFLFKIYKYQNSWVLEDNGYNETKVYLNNIHVKKSYINTGDVIFTHGFKLIWMPNFIKITNPNNKVMSSLKPMETFNQFGGENEFTPVKETEKNIVLYNENQTFFHTPRIKSTIIEKNIKISNPPPKRENTQPPAILSLGPTIMMGISSTIPVVLAVFNLQKGNIVNAIVEIAVCLFMISGSVLFPILLAKFNKNRYKKEEAKRQKEYTRYLNEKRQAISDEIKKQITILYENNLSTEQCKSNIANRTSIWNREIQDNDFLTIRLGIGNQKAKIKIEATLEDFSMDDDNLRKEVEKIIATPLILENVPITISLIENRILPLIIENDYQYKKQLIDNILLQLMTYHSGTDLKIVILTDENNAKNWDFLKYTPYCTNSTQDKIFFATNEEEMQQLSNYLIDVYRSRKKAKEDIDKDPMQYTQYNEYYLIITDDFINSKKIDIIKNIVKDTINVGFSLLTIESSMKNVPSRSNNFVKISNKEAIISGKDIINEERYNFTPDLLVTDDIKVYANCLANIPISFTDKISMLPSYLEFLEMYKVGKIEQLNIVERWMKNDPTVSLAAQVGIDEEGKPIYLDLHEKFHGPHGLIAGSTGSGKSEFIITYILSMAVNYHPYEVQFVIIDYKGGGLAGAFENRETKIKIPHLVGTITNLDGSEMNRALVSIKSELQRRQKLFNEARNQLGESTIDIYKYQKFYRNGSVKVPISHLFIISDEFAELKSQQPEFMNELISTARIGRSLGVHLILATQKPSGVVDDQIWSNSRFKICLKVQTENDSNELLKRPEAASIKETGRFYMQIGYDELFTLAQSAWSGAKYSPTDKIVKNVDNSIKFVDNNGNVIKQIDDSTKDVIQENYGDQLTNIVKFLYDISQREKIQANYLWLPSIPPEIFISSLAKKYKYTTSPYYIDPLIGEYDIPANQVQELLKVNFSDNGNLIIYGKTGSGKENLIRTLLYSICNYHSSDEINIYIADFGAETLKIFQDYPHVGDIFLLNDIDKLDNLFKMLENEMNRRKELFAPYGGNYNSYINANGTEKIPVIMTILNGYEAFVENPTSPFDEFVSLTRDATKYGIYFVMSVVTVNTVPIKLAQSFSNIMALQLSDVLDYRFSFHAPEGLVPAKYFGRGLVVINENAYEFQTAYIYTPESINDVIKLTSKQLLEKNMKKARKVPIIPKIITPEYMLSYIDSIENVPIGINIYNGEIIKYNFTSQKITTILGISLILKNNFIRALIDVLNSIPNIRLRIIDFSDSIKNTDQSIEYINNDFTNAIRSITSEESNTKCKIVYLINGIGYIKEKVLDEGIIELNRVLNSVDNYSNSFFILSDNLSTYKKLQDDNWHTLMNNKNGIWIGKNIENQNIFEIANLTENDSNYNDEDIMYIINDQVYTVAKSIAIEGDDFY